MMHTFAEVYASMYIGAGYDVDEGGKRFEVGKQAWESVKGPPLAGYLSRPWRSDHQRSVTLEYGPYVFQQMLRRRIGNDRYFGALDLFLADHAGKEVTTEELQRYFELASESDLSDFFDFWVHQSIVPKLTLTWSVNKGAVTGSVKSDIAFGSFDVPVRIEDPNGVQDVWVNVVDGEGTLESVAVKGKKPTVKLDPMGMTLARKRKVVQEK